MSSPATPDRVYKLDLSRPRAVHARITGDVRLNFSSTCPYSSSPNPSLCQPGAYGDLPSVFNATNRLDLLEVPAGTYSLIVETAPQAAALDYSLTLWADEPPEGRSCSAALRVTLDGGVAEVLLDMDAYAGFRPVSPLDISQGVPESASVCFAIPIVQVPSVVDISANGSPFQRTVGTLGDLDFEFSTSAWVPHRFDFRATYTPPPPGSCAAPYALTFELDAGVSQASISGDTSVGFAGVEASCGAAPYLTWGFTLSAPQRLFARVSTTSADYLPALALRGSDCGGPSGPCSLAAMTGGSAELDGGLLPAGSYFLWVGGGSAFVTDDAGTTFRPTSGPFTLDVATW